MEVAEGGATVHWWHRVDTFTLLSYSVIGVRGGQSLLAMRTGTAHSRPALIFTVVVSMRKVACLKQA